MSLPIGAAARAILERETARVEMQLRALGYNDATIGPMVLGAILAAFRFRGAHPIGYHVDSLVEGATHAEAWSKVRP